MALEDLTPFGTLPKAYQGLLGAEETAALQKRAQIQGLLGAGLALAKGMSAYGPPRSALQNILGAVAGGFEGAGGAYEGGIKQIGTAQQMQQLKLQREQAVAQSEAVKQLLQDPTIASDPAAVAYIRANPVEAVKEISQRRMREGELAKLRQARTGGVTPVGSMTAEIDAQIQSLRDNAQIAASQGKADQASQYITAANNLTKEKQNIAAANFDFAGLKESVPESLRANVDFLAKQAKDGVIGGDKVFEGIQSIQTAARESAKGNLLGNEKARDYALTQFNTADITKLTQPQRDNALRYAEAPSDADRAKIFNDGLKLKFETGQAAVVPAARTSFLGQNQPPVTSQVAPVNTVAPAAETPAAAPRAVTQPVTTTQPSRVTPAATQTAIPLIEKPDNVVPVQQKQKLIQSQPATISLANYSLDNISQQKKAAEELLNNPKYIKALTSSNLVGGYITEKLAERPGNTAFDANNLLKNLQTRSFVSEIQRMRAASPTGGAVGSVTEKEMEGLSNIGAAIKAGMSEKELTTQLKKYITNADRALKTIPNEYSKTYRYQGEFDQYLNPNQSPATPAATSNRVGKYNVKTGQVEY
jgi:hypothetical protein